MAWSHSSRDRPECGPPCQTIREHRHSSSTCSRVANALAMDPATGPEDATFADIRQRNRTEIEMDLVAEFLPQVVGQAACPIAAAAGRRDRRAEGRAARVRAGREKWRGGG